MFDIEQYVRDFFKLPGPALVKEWVREWDAITVHTQGRLPRGIIGKRRPYEEEAIKQYREDNYEPITKDPFSRALTNLQRIFGRANVTITMPDALKDYVEQRVFDGVDFLEYFSRRVVRRMIEDPNGFLVWWPTKVPSLNEKLTPLPYLVLSKNVKHMTDEVFTWLSEERSVVIAPKEGTGERVEQRLGEVYYICTKNGYYKLSQYGEQHKRNFELLPHMTHSLEYIPALVLGGDETGRTNRKTNRDEMWYTTFFAPAVPFANECIRQFSDHQGIMVTSGFPLREMDAQKCVARGCKNGLITVTKESALQGKTAHEVNCEVCNGTGRILPMGPFGVLYRPEPNLTQSDTSSREVPVMRYIAPPVEILEYSGKHYQHLLDRTEKALNLLFIEEAQSGVAKDIDREDKVSTLDRIGGHLYSLVEASLYTVGKLRNVSFDEDGLAINLPPTFVVKTEKDLMEEVKTLRDGGAGPLFLGEAMSELIRKRFPGNMRVIRMAEILQAYDVLYGYTDEQRTLMRASGSVDLATYSRSIYAPAALNRLVEQFGDEFLKRDYKAIEGALDDLINELMPEPEAPPLNNVPPDDDEPPVS